MIACGSKSNVTPARVESESRSGERAKRNSSRPPVTDIVVSAVSAILTPAS